MLYEDGDKEWLNLIAERVEWEQEEQPESTEAEVEATQPSFTLIIMFPDACQHILPYSLIMMCSLKWAQNSATASHVMALAHARTCGHDGLAMMPEA